MKTFTTTIIIMLFCLAAVAGQNLQRDSVKLSNTAGLKKARAEKQPAADAFISPISLQLLSGTQGVGADVKYGVSPKLSGRLGFGIIPVDASRGFGFSNFPVKGQLSTRFTNVHLLADYSPFKTHFFRLVGGASYLVRGNADVLISPASGYTVGSQSLSQNQIGDLRATATWRGVAPYLGCALFRSFPYHFFNVNLDLGTYYLSSPGTSFTGTKLLSDNDESAKQFNQNMQGYRWLPVVQLNFNFRIK
jgi:hypothetical protein